MSSQSVPSHSVPTREIAMVALAAVALFYLLAILSYSPHDSGFSYASSNTDVSNWVGRSGAWCADLGLYLLGYVAYLIPLQLMAVGVLIFKGRALEQPGWITGVRALGWFAVIFSLAALVQMHTQAGSNLPAGGGGVIGTSMVTSGRPVFGWVGLTLLGVTGLLVGLQAALGFSWLAVAEQLGRLLHRSGSGFAHWWVQQRDAWAARAEQRAQQRSLREQRKASLADHLGSKRKNAPVVIEQSAGTQSMGNKMLNRLAPTLAGASRGAAKQKAPEPKKPTLLTPKPVSAQRSLFKTSAGNSTALPDLELLDEPTNDPNKGFSTESLEAMSRLLELKLKDFGVDAEVVTVLPGPVVTRFEIQPAPGVKVQKISSLAKDLARSLAVISVRIVEIIPGKSVVGIEIPNEDREIVRLKEVLETPTFLDSPSPLTLALGKDIAGQPIVADIAKMPHLLVAGTTGAGKSVGVNAMILSILYKATPEEVRLILVDPKMLELAIYEGIPHLLTPVVTDMTEAAQALNWCVAEMDRRYQVMSKLGVRNLSGFNKKVKQAAADGEPILDPLWPADNVTDAPPLEALPLIVVVIDEFADMMMVVGKKVEQLIARIAQKARAAGIHLVLATQRPSVDVITGLIKANVPTRISFQVSSKIDSRTILDQGGAEQLLGHGDMLYLPPGTALPVRVHGAFVSDEEVHRIVADWKSRSEPDYLEEVLTGGDGEPFLQLESDTEQEDALYDEAVEFVLESRRASISSVQRKLRIGYNRAARLIEAMEMAGLVSAMGSNGSRELLVPKRD